MLSSREERVEEFYLLGKQMVTRIDQSLGNACGTSVAEPPLGACDEMQRTIRQGREAPEVTMVQIMKRVVDKDGNVISQTVLDVDVSSRREAEKYVRAHIAKAYSHSGYNDEQGYWWGRQDGSSDVSRYTVEL